MNVARIAARIAGPSSLVVRVALRIARLAAGTFHLRDSMLHVQKNDVQESSLPDELKQAFLNALSVKEGFQSAIPMSDHMLDDDKAIDRLDKKAGSTVFAIEGLADKVSSSGAKVDPGIGEHVKELDRHGFIPGRHIPKEANDWAWNAHEVISKLFDIAAGKQDD